MTISEKQEWQFVDKRLGILFPYYTMPCLEVIDQWDFRGKDVFEYGLGASSWWYAIRGANVHGVDDNPDYFKRVQEGAIAANFYTKMKIKLEEDSAKYVNSIYEHKILFDIIIIDGEHWRDECFGPALDKIKPGGVLIVDNWCQPSVYMPSEVVRNEMWGRPVTIYKEPSHEDWQTAIYKIYK